MDVLAEATANTRLIAIYRQLADELDRIYAMFLAEARGLDRLKRSDARGRVALADTDHGRRQYARRATPRATASWRSSDAAPALAEKPDRTYQAS